VLCRQILLSSNTHLVNNNGAFGRTHNVHEVEQK
jgi:hypothetical protein